MAEQISLVDMGGGTFLNTANFIQALVALQVKEQTEREELTVSVHLFGGNLLVLDGAEGEKLLTDLGLRRQRVEVARGLPPPLPLSLRR